MKTGDIARICHEANRAYCHAHHDNTQLPWPVAPDWVHESAIKGVHFAQQNPNSTAEDQHRAWSDDKIAQGWRFGRVKDADRKEHPCLVEYAELPEFQRKKDELFLAIVRALS